MKKIIILTFLVCSLCACHRTTTVTPDVDKSLVKEEQLYQKALVLKKAEKYRDRGYGIGYKILQAGMPLCSQNWMYYQGVEFDVVDTIEDDMRPVYEKYCGLSANSTEGLFVKSVYRDSPAYVAGLTEGMVIHKIDGVEIETSGLLWKDKLEDLVEESNDDGRVVYTVEKDGVVKDIAVDSAKVCAYPIVLKKDRLVNAFANGEEIILTTGILKELPDDDQIAVIVGHELGHNLSGHISQSQNTMTVGSFVDLLVIGLTGVNSTVGRAVANEVNKGYSLENEEEADYFGMYMGHLAGYDVSSAADVWRGLGSDNPYSISHDTTHPSTAS